MRSSSRSLKRTRVGVVGLGMGRAHLRGYQNAPNCDIVAVCDLDGTRLESAAQEFDVPHTLSHKRRWLRWACLLWVVWLLAIESLPAYARKTHSPRTIVPQVASLLGVKVGYSTMETLERRLGPGLAITGGHPRGARLWRAKGAGWLLYADGFDYGRGGRLIDTLVINPFPENYNDRKFGPLANVSRRRQRLLGVIAMGMPFSQVAQALKGRTPVARLRKGRARFSRMTTEYLAWQAHGRVKVDERLTYDTWDVEVHFRQGRVWQIYVACG